MTGMTKGISIILEFVILYLCLSAFIFLIYFSYQVRTHIRIALRDITKSGCYELMVIGE